MTLPFISRESVQRQLDALLYDSASSASPGDLDGLLLVEQINVALPRASSDLRRDYAVRELLIHLILDAYFEVRRALELPEPPRDLPLRAVEAWLRADAAPRNPVLLGWSLLYHRYARVDLNLSVTQLASLISAGERTFRRYQAYAVRLLTYRLIRAEAVARFEQKRRFLRLALPPMTASRLIGRDVAALPVVDADVMLLTGVKGVGKTAFARALIDHWIDLDRFDAILWLDQPRSARAVLGEIAALLQPEGFGLRERLSITRLGLILDDVSALEPELSALLTELDGAFVLIINRAHVPVDGARVMLRDLPPDATELLARELLERYSSDDVEDYREIARYAYERFGGNPGALKAALMQWAYAEWRVVEADVLRQYFGEMFESLPLDARLGWRALTIAPYLPSSALTALLNPEALVLLLRHHLVERHGDTYLLALNGAGQYVRLMASPALDHAFAALLERLFTVDAAAVYPLAEALLCDETTVATLTPEQRLAACQRYCAIGIERGQHARWRSILEAVASAGLTLDADLRANYGVILRRLGEWEGAQAVFRDVTAELGRRGEFYAQARVLLEWSISVRLQGQFQQALDLIAQARRHRHADDELRARAAVLEAQLWVESQQGRKALQLLTGLPETPRVLHLKSEAHLALGDFELCRRYARTALAAADMPMQASLLTTIGRACEGEGDLETAESCFARAVSLLERTGDAYALARAKSNLAALLIKRHGYADARQLLTDAEIVQAQLGDRVGLMTTRHNRTILHNALFSA